MVDVVEIYPREGTETSCGATPKQFNTLKFIPVRGRKHVGSITFVTYRSVEIYPREGTETVRI